MDEQRCGTCEYYDPDEWCNGSVGDCTYPVILVQLPIAFIRHCVRSDTGHGCKCFKRRKEVLRG